MTTVSERLGGGRRRLVLLAAGIAVTAVVWSVGHWASAPVYVTLYSGLELTESASIEEALDEAAIPFELTLGGTEIRVPVADIARARVALARDGLALGRPGLELFDKPSWGMTDFSQRVTFQRALEGELARTIAGIHGVQRAQVHLALPRPSPLRGAERTASASVVLSVEPGLSLSGETIQGITYVVSNSIEGMALENVAVMDDGGRVLSVPAAGAQGLSSRQLEMQRSMEETLVRKVLTLLEPIVGQGRVRAEVAAQLDFDRVDRTVETFGPVAEDGGPAEGTTPSSPPAGNTPDFNSHEFERSERSMGKLIRLTAAVLVDEPALGAPTGGGTPAAGGANERVSLPQIEAMVRDAIGIDAVRGDRLSVLAVPFEAIEAGGEAEGTVSDGSGGLDILGLVERWTRPAIGLVAIVMLSLMALRVLRMPAGSPAPPGGPEALPAGEPGANPMAGAAPVAAAGPDAKLRIVRDWLQES